MAFSYLILTSNDKTDKKNLAETVFYTILYPKKNKTTGVWAKNPDPDHSYIGTKSGWPDQIRPDPDPRHCTGYDSSST